MFTLGPTLCKQHPHERDITSRIQCDVFYSTNLGHCRDVAHMLKSRYESAGYYEFNIYVDGKLVYSSGNFLNLNDQNKSFRYFVET